MTLVTLILTLLACPTSSSGEACPTDVPLTDADMGCDCAGEVIDALPGCGDYVCTEDGAEVDGGCETAGCKGIDCG